MLYGADAEILGLGSSKGGGGNAKLSRERRHRMREHATQKLSHAYRLDEIASSVAVMQSTSALEDVAKHVLQRNELDPDAQYVHFFHEKIPSMCMADYTDLGPLSDVIRQRPAEASTYRTRAVARVFKSDMEGAARDCTEGLATFRLYHPEHQDLDRQRGIVLAKDAAKLNRDYRPDGRIEEKDQPSSLETQLLFHRGNAYLTLSCDNIGRALQGTRKGGRTSNGAPHDGDLTNGAATDLEKDQARDRAEARKLVRTFAKRALRDYVAFLSHFDYTPGISAEYAEAFLDRVKSADFGQGRRSRSERLLDLAGHSGTGLSEALVKYEGQKESQQPLPQIPKPPIYTLNTLFAASPPAGLPPYPPEPGSRPDHSGFSLPDLSEAVTYHPLLTDVLHSLLLCHCLIQTSSKEHLRHAYMAARIARVCDGYPVFLAARSPARADWIEVLRRSKNWLGLSASWEDLCSPAPLPEHGADFIRKENAGGGGGGAAAGTSNGSRLIEQPSIDQCTTDQEALRATLRAREQRAVRREEEAARKEYCRTKMPENGGYWNGLDSAAPTRKMKRWAQDDGREYPITTERAEAIVRWIMEAPPPSSVDGSKRPKKRSTGTKGKARGTTAASVSTQDTGLEENVDSLDLVD